MGNLSLFNIQAEYLQLAARITEAGGELTPELETALAINAETLQHKAIQYTLVIKDHENDIVALEKEISRLQALKTSREKANEVLGATISNAMQLYGISEIKGENFRLSFRKSKSLKITDEKLIPAFFKESIPATTKVINADVKKALSNGEEVPGAVIVEKQNLQIK